MGLYLNDLPPRATLARQVHDAARALGRTSPTSRVAADVLASRLSPRVEDYLEELRRDHDPAGPDHGRRWAQLREELRDLGAEAARRGGAPPLLVLLPALVEFEAYPFAAAHRDLGRLGESQGFEVLDPLPSFRARTPDGATLRASPNDSHFGPLGHELLAEALEARLDPPGAPR